MTSKFLLALLGAGSAFALNPPVYADPAPLAEELGPVALAGAETPPLTTPQNPFGDASAVDEPALQAVSGMASLQQYATANNSSVVAGNSVNGQSVTGGISIDGQSFHDLHGLSILTANTGNNVSINAAMNVNVSIQQ